MRVIGEFDTKDYCPEWRTFFREAVRAVVQKGNQIALVKSEKEHYYKFPGGGIEPGESHLEALCREVREETGLQVKPESVREFGIVHEKRKSAMAEEIFEQKSYYYVAEVRDLGVSQDLDDYEAELGYRLEWTDILPAYECNRNVLENRSIAMIQREAYVLGLLLSPPISAK